MYSITIKNIITIIKIIFFYFTSVYKLFFAENHEWNVKKLMLSKIFNYTFFISDFDIALYKAVVRKTEEEK